MTPTRLAGPTVTASAEIDPALLRAAGLEHERVVMLEPTDAGLTVRKLTPLEKREHSQRTDEPAFLGSEAELDAYLAAIPAADDPAA
ncbi:MAG: hypothetical protein QOE28_3013 [Solirubrobacteraceae bacterium]|jgi:hypothetical protein|nr:hypothetical protein [Solirubrobacteraceae bacterium]